MSFLRLLAILVGLAVAQPAMAHAVLTSSEPAEGAVLMRAPGKVELRFNEPVQLLVLRLIDARGATHELAANSLGDRVEAAMPDGLPEGTQILSYRVVSLDGHPVGASILFSVGKAEGAPQLSLENSYRTIWIWAAKGLDLALQLAGAGMAFFFAFLSPAPASSAFRRISVATLGLGIPLIILSVGLQGLDLLGLPLSSILDLKPWIAVSGSTFFTMSLLELLTVVLAVAALMQTYAHFNKFLSILALLSVGCARAASGHAALADPVWLMRPAVFLHTTMVAIWFGALPPLLWLALTQIHSFKDALWRFATTALMSVEILLIAGLALATVQIREATTLLTTDYGRILVIKLSLVTLLLLLALWNRHIATPSVMAGDKKATKLISVSIAIEILLIISILGVAALWRFTPPPRAILETNTKAKSYSVHLHSNSLMVDLKVEPPMSGNARITLFIQDETGIPLSAKEIAVTLDAPWLGIEPRTLIAKRLDNGLWQIPSAYFPAPGEWVATINAMVDDFEQHRIEGTLQIHPSQPAK